MPDENPTPLEHELQTFARMLPTLMDRVGEFAVIFGDELVGTFSTWEDACKAGYSRAGASNAFLVKRIEQSETINFFTRDLDFLCPI